MSPDREKLIDEALAALPAEPEQEDLAVGDRFVQVTPAPGYPPDKLVVTGFPREGWVSVTRRFGSWMPIPRVSLLNPKLWRKVEPAEPEQEACGRLMVGSGIDTYGPLCELPKGHVGPCKSTAAIDQHRLAEPVGAADPVRAALEEIVDYVQFADDPWLPLVLPATLVAQARAALAKPTEGEKP